MLALTFGPDFIHWRRSGELWPSVWPGRRFFCLLNSPAAVAAQVRGRIAALGARELTVRVWLRRAFSLGFRAGEIAVFIPWRGRQPNADGALDHARALGHGAADSCLLLWGGGRRCWCARSTAAPAVSYRAIVTAGRAIDPR